MHVAQSFWLADPAQSQSVGLLMMYADPFGTSSSETQRKPAMLKVSAHTQPAGHSLHDE